MYLAMGVGILIAIVGFCVALSTPDPKPQKVPHKQRKVS